MQTVSWWCEEGRCFSCTYPRCNHRCHDGQLHPITPGQRTRAQEQARDDLERYFRSSTSWRGYGHAAAIDFAERRV